MLIYNALVKKLTYEKRDLKGVTKKTQWKTIMMPVKKSKLHKIPI